MTLLSDKLSLIGLLVILLEVALVVLVVSPEQARRARRTLRGRIGGRVCNRHGNAAKVLQSPVRATTAVGRSAGMHPALIDRRAHHHRAVSHQVGRASADDDAPAAGAAAP